MSYFRRIFFANEPPDPGTPGFTFSSLSSQGLKLIISAALFLIALGVLVLIFPLILAFFVAGICFLIALWLLRLAWTVYRHTRPPKQPRIHVHIHEPDEVV